MSKYIKDVPKTLLEDFVENKVIPFVGAGFSKNAILPNGLAAPDWNELGKKVADYIPDYEYANAIDALSLFETHFSRVKLMELLSKMLHVNELKPGDAHRSFCNVFFDTICTTNFDFLLEHTLQETRRPHSIIVSEDRLPIDTHEKTKLIKLHGDFNHPERMVVTERDYDLFLEKNKVLATYTSNLFITKTLLLVGYSFEDTDIRNIWQIINSRLGQLHRPAYAVMVDASSIEISRFERRNIKVINLKGKRADYPIILHHFFTEIKQVIDEKSPEKITATNEKVREELKLPVENKRLCFISAPYTHISFLKELIYPLLEEKGITPITLDEVIMPEDNWMTKSETLIKEASFAIVDASGNNSNVMWELGVVTSLKKPNIVIVEGEQYEMMKDRLRNYEFLKYSTKNGNKEFLYGLNEILFKYMGSEHVPENNEPERLLQKNEYDAAVISAFRLLERSIREEREKYLDNYKCNFNELILNFNTKINSSYSYLKSDFLNKKIIPDALLKKFIDYISIRNQIVHGTTYNVGKKKATEIVKTINELIDMINKHKITFGPEP